MADEILRLSIDDPLNILIVGDQVVLPPRSTVEEATDRAVKIRKGIERYAAEIVPLVREAFLHSDWTALNYGSWDAYIRGEFGLGRLRLPKDERREAVKLFRTAGMSTRAIAPALGVDQSTIVRDVAATDAKTSDDGIKSLDGRQRPATRSAPVESSHNPAEGVDGAPSDALRAAPPAVSPEAVEEVALSTREVEWPEVTRPGVGAVTSATPSNPSAEAPATAPADSEYAPWRRHWRVQLAAAQAALMDITSDLSDPATVAERCEPGDLDTLDKLGRQLVQFVAEVHRLRQPRVWMAAVRRGTAYHQIDPMFDGETVRYTLCGRLMRTGEVLTLVEAQVRGGAPCKVCETATVEPEPEPEPAAVAPEPEPAEDDMPDVGDPKQPVWCAASVGPAAYHRLAGDTTRCGLLIEGGELYSLEFARGDRELSPCTGCWDGAP